jgi:hypothetical protein
MSFAKKGSTMYAPQLGRFINRDPIGYFGGINLYEYVNGQPTIAVDPTGLVVDLIFDYKSGTLTATDRDTGQTLVLHGVFSGEGACRNNPNLQGVKDEGPVPVGTYYVVQGSDHRSSPSSNSQGHPGGTYWWYWLWAVNPRVGPERGVYVPNPDGSISFDHPRTGMFLHVGSVSHGCITVPSTQPASCDGKTPNPYYPNSDDWNKLRQMLDNTKPGSSWGDGNIYRGELHVVTQLPTPPTTQPSK